jgi:hypothetical protein
MKDSILSKMALKDPRTRKDFMTILPSDLYKGSILPIYEDWRGQEGLLGFARLNYNLFEEGEPFERGTVGDSDEERVYEPDMVIFKSQKWNITYLDPWEVDKSIPVDIRWKFLHMKGFTTNWRIAYFVTIDSNYIS